MEEQKDGGKAEMSHGDDNSFTAIKVCVEEPRRIIQEATAHKALLY